MMEEKCVVIENVPLGGRYFRLKAQAPGISPQAKAGNFVMVGVPGVRDPLLKRPFGIVKAEPPFLWLYYQVVGRGTTLMSAWRSGQEFYMVGPLGNSFPALKRKNILLVAGGRGIAPIFFGIQYYAPANMVLLAYGGKSAADLNLLEDMSDIGTEGIYLFTDDGSRGQKGLVTSRVRAIIRERKIDVTVSCGPQAMLAQLAREIGESGTDNYVSLEALMGCGFGACHSCVVKTRSGDYRHVCSDGPVFKLEEIAW